MGGPARGAGELPYRVEPQPEQLTPAQIESATRFAERGSLLALRFAMRRELAATRAASSAAPAEKRDSPESTPTPLEGGGSREFSPAEPAGAAQVVLGVADGEVARVDVGRDVAGRGAAAPREVAPARAPQVTGPTWRCRGCGSPVPWAAQADHVRDCPFAYTMGEAFRWGPL